MSIEDDAPQTVWGVKFDGCFTGLSYVAVSAPTAEQAVALLTRILKDEDHPQYNDAMAAVIDNSQGYEPLEPRNISFEDVELDEEPDYCDWPLDA